MQDYLALGIEEWRKSYAENEKLGKKAVLFVMVDDTRNCDEVGAHLHKSLSRSLKVTGCWSFTRKTTARFPNQLPAKTRKSCDRLRKASNEIDTWQSPVKAIVSVLMLKEGWDVRNVTTIVGLRAYVSKSQHSARTDA